MDRNRVKRAKQTIINEKRERERKKNEHTHTHTKIEREREESCMYKKREGSSRTVENQGKLEPIDRYIAHRVE